jgi:hypothetical protein
MIFPVKIFEYIHLVYRKKRHEIIGDKISADDYAMICDDFDLLLDDQGVLDLRKFFAGAVLFMDKEMVIRDYLRREHKKYGLKYSDKRNWTILSIVDDKRKIMSVESYDGDDREYEVPSYDFVSNVTRLFVDAYPKIWPLLTESGNYQALEVLYGAVNRRLSMDEVKFYFSEGGRLAADVTIIAAIEDGLTITISAEYDEMSDYFQSKWRLFNVGVALLRKPVRSRKGANGDKRALIPGAKSDRR